jgi:hypothetical protein
MPMVLSGYLRLVSSPKVFQQATPIEDPAGFVEALLLCPGVQLAHLGPEWPKLRQLCVDKQLGGNDMPDAWLAAAVAHMDEQLVSLDRHRNVRLCRRRQRGVRLCRERDRADEAPHAPGLHTARHRLPLIRRRPAHRAAGSPGRRST